MLLVIFGFHRDIDPILEWTTWKVFILYACLLAAIYSHFSLGKKYGFLIIWRIVRHLRSFLLPDPFKLETDNSFSTFSAFFS